LFFDHPLKHIAHVHLEQKWRHQLVAHEILENRQFNVGIHAHPMYMEFDPRGEKNALIAG
jgi:hypothetical protein